MVRIDFPVELTKPDFLGSLIRESAEDFITKNRIENAQIQEGLRHYFEAGYINGHRGDKPIQGFFDALGLVEKETLNGIATAGSCQFSCLADQLYGKECSREWRADIYLRRLALYVIATNEDEFRCFMLHANPKTRRQNKTAGESVDIEGYVKKMAQHSTDGDHLTLQALCDALQCPIHVIQLVDSPQADRMLSHLSLKTVVVNELHPRTLPHMHPRTARLQVHRRELWLTLRGEAHFRSLHSTSFSDEEAQVATAELQLLQHHLPDPPPTPTNSASSRLTTYLSNLQEVQIATAELQLLQHHLPDPPPTPTNSVSSGGTASAGGMNGGRKGHHYSSSGSSYVQSMTSEIQPTETCSICLEDVIDDSEEEKLLDNGGNFAARSVGAVILMPTRTRRGGASKSDHEEGEGEAPVRPNICQHTFHLQCLTGWVKMSNSCPNCKGVFQSIERLHGGKSIPVLTGRKGPAYNHLTDDEGIGWEDYERDGEEEREENSEEDPDDAVRCYICSHGNNSRLLLLCDGPGCQASAHTFCLGLQGVPEGQWYCRTCRRLSSVTDGGATDEDGLRSSADSDEGGRRRRVGTVASRGSPGVGIAAGGGRGRRRITGQWPPDGERRRRSAGEGGLIGVGEGDEEEEEYEEVEGNGRRVRRRRRTQSEERFKEEMVVVRCCLELPPMEGSCPVLLDEQEEEDRITRSTASTYTYLPTHLINSHNPLALEIQRRHGSEVLPSTTPYGRVLSSARRAEEERTARSTAISAAAAAAQGGGASTIAPGTITITSTTTAAATGGRRLVIATTSQEEEMLQAFLQREKALSHLQQQQQQRGGGSSSGDRAAGARGGGKVYEISSSDSEGEERKGGGLKKEEESEVVLVGTKTVAPSFASVTTTTTTIVPPPINTTTTTTHIRPQLRPTLSSSSGGGLGIGIPIGSLSRGGGGLPSAAAGGGGKISITIGPGIGGGGGKITTIGVGGGAEGGGQGGGGGAGGKVNVPIGGAGGGGIGGGGGGGGTAIGAKRPRSSIEQSRADVRGLLAKLDAAVEADIEAVKRGWPPMEMSRVTGELNAIFSLDQRDQARLLNAGLLGTLKRFLDPIPGHRSSSSGGNGGGERGGPFASSSITPSHTKTVILRLLQILPIGMSHLRDSGIIRVLLSVITQPGESRADRESVQTLIRNWGRFVYNVKANGAHSTHHLIGKGGWPRGPQSPRSPPSYLPTNSSSSSSHFQRQHSPRSNIGPLALARGSRANSPFPSSASSSCVAVGLSSIAAAVGGGSSSVSASVPPSYQPVSDVAGRLLDGRSSTATTSSRGGASSPSPAGGGGGILGSVFRTAGR